MLERSDAGGEDDSKKDTFGEKVEFDPEKVLHAVAQRDQCEKPYIDDDVYCTVFNTFERTPKELEEYADFAAVAYEDEEIEELE